MSRRQKVLFWLFFLLALFSLIVLLQGILLPFILGLLVAYFLDPVADRLEQTGFSRQTATATITVVFFGIMTLIIILIVPLLFSLVEAIPDYFLKAKAYYKPYIDSLIERYHLAEQVKKMTEKGDAVISLGSSLISNILAKSTGFLGNMYLIFISPFVAYYLLRDWDHMIAKVDAWLPRKHAATIRGLCKEMDAMLSGYIRGYTMTCILLGIFYGLGLEWIGLNFGFAIGFMTGLLAFIPFIGLTIGMAVALLVGFFQFHLSHELFLILTVFGVGHFIEGNFVTPKIIGVRTGLPPVWIIFALLAGASLFGITGVLLAIPITAMLGVLMRFTLGMYLESDLYEVPGKHKAGIERERAALKNAITKAPK